MLRVMLRREFVVDADQLHSCDLEALVLKARNDPADKAALHGVRLAEYECSLNRHSLPPTAFVCSVRPRLPQ